MSIKFEDNRFEDKKFDDNRENGVPDPVRLGRSAWVGRWVGVGTLNTSGDK